jgi:hypothetical protein
MKINPKKRNDKKNRMLFLFMICPLLHFSVEVLDHISLGGSLPAFTSFHDSSGHDNWLSQQALAE